MANSGNLSPSSKSPNSNLSSIDPSFKIVDTFQSLYHKRLLDAGESFQLKNIVLRDWVDDLSAQNEAVVRSLKVIENDISKKGTGSWKMEDSEPLRKRVAELEECVERLNRTICEKDTQISRVMCESSQLKEQCEQQAMTLQSQEVATDENAELKVELQELKCCLREKECQIQQITQQLAEVTSTLCTREEEMTRSTVNKLDFCSRIEQLEETVSCLRRENENKEELLKKYCRECTSMKRELAEGKRQKEEMNALRNEVECMRDELAQKSCALEKAKAHIKELRSSNYGFSQPSAPSRNAGPYPPQEMRGNKNEDVGGSGDSALLELHKKLDNQKDLQKALTAEVAEKHDTIISLKDQIRELENKLRQTEKQAHFKDDIIRELRKEVKLGRAKESLAEMLGLKEGPRVQMKARIDRLNAELEDKINEISKLNSLIDNSSLASLENRVRTLTLDLESRDRRMLAMCDKLDYVRSYLHQLKTEEQLSIKCGLEALITELNDDAENNREVRRNVSISLDKEPNDNIIIINHRSHSLPDSALQRQVHNFQVSSKCSPQNYLHGVPSRSVRFAFEDLSKLKKLGSSLESSQTNLCRKWNAIRQTSEDELMKCQEELDSIIESLEADHQCIFTVCSHFENFSARLLEAHAKCSPNEFLFTSIEDCLKNALNRFDANLMCDPDNTMMVKMKSLLYHNMESSITVALSHLERAKTHCVSQKELICTVDLLKLSEDKKMLESIASNKLNAIRQLSSVKSLHDSYSKSITNKLTEFDCDIVQHLSKTKSVKSELEVIVEQVEKLQGADSSLISVYTSTDDLPLMDSNQVPCTSGQVLDNVLKRVDSSKLLEIMDNDAQLVELFSPSTPFRSKFSHSSFQGDSTSRETGENNVGIEERGNLLRKVVTSLSSEMKNLITLVIQRDQKVFDFEKSGFALCKFLDRTHHELTNALAFTASLGITSEKHTSLVQSLSDTACEVQKLLKEAKAYMSEREMIEALRLKKELCVSNLMVDLTKNVEEIVSEVKNAQHADDDLLRSFSSQIQSYKEKILELESVAATPNSPSTKLEDVSNEVKKDEIISALTVELNSIKEQYEELQARLVNEREEKLSMKAENERTLEELQMKISKLQEVLQQEKATSREIARLEDVLKDKEDQLTEMEAALGSENVAAFNAQTALRELKEKLMSKLKMRDCEINTLTLELEELRNKFHLSELEIEKLELQAQEYRNELQQWRIRANDNKEAVGKVMEENKELKEQYKNFFSEKERKLDSVNNKLLETEGKCRQLTHERGVLMRQCKYWADESERMKEALKSQNAKAVELCIKYNKIVEENELIRSKEEAVAKSYREKLERLEDVLKLKDVALEHLQQELKNFMMVNESMNGKFVPSTVEREDKMRSENAYSDVTSQIAKLKGEVKCYSNRLPSNGYRDDHDSLKCSLAAYEKKISELLMERSNHLLMIKRMRDFTGQLSKLCPQGDAEVGSSVFSDTSDFAESSHVSSAIVSYLWKGISHELNDVDTK